MAVTQNPEEPLERRKAWLSDGKRADRAPAGLLHSLFSAFFYSHLCDLFSKSAGAFPLRRRSVIELLEEVAAVLIGHTWLFHRWPIYLPFGEGTETRRTRIARRNISTKRGRKGERNGALQEGADGNKLFTWSCFTLLCWRDESRFTGQ